MIFCAFDFTVSDGFLARFDSTAICFTCALLFVFGRTGPSSHPGKHGPVFGREEAWQWDGRNGVGSHLLPHPADASLHLGDESSGPSGVRDLSAARLRQRTGLECLCDGFVSRFEEGRKVTGHQGKSDSVDFADVKFIKCRICIHWLIDWLILAWILREAALIDRLIGQILVSIVREVVDWLIDWSNSLSFVSSFVECFSRQIYLLFWFQQSAPSFAFSSFLQGICITPMAKDIGFYIMVGLLFVIAVTVVAAGVVDCVFRRRYRASPHGLLNGSDADNVPQIYEQTKTAHGNGLTLTTTTTTTTTTQQLDGQRQPKYGYANVPACLKPRELTNFFSNFSLRIFIFRSTSTRGIICFGPKNQIKPEFAFFFHLFCFSSFLLFIFYFSKKFSAQKCVLFYRIFVPYSCIYFCGIFFCGIFWVFLAVLCFHMMTNVRAIFSSQTEGEISFLHGFRVLAVWWIVSSLPPWTRGTRNSKYEFVHVSYPLDLGKHLLARQQIFPWVIFDFFPPFVNQKWPLHFGAFSQTHPSVPYLASQGTDFENHEIEIFQRFFSQRIRWRFTGPLKPLDSSWFWIRVRGWMLLRLSSLLCSSSTDPCIIFPHHFLSKRKEFFFSFHEGYAVDTFFLVSGAMLAYVLYRDLSKHDGKINWVLVYFRRWWWWVFARLFARLVFFH